MAFVKGWLVVYNDFQGTTESHEEKQKWFWVCSLKIFVISIFKNRYFLKKILLSVLMHIKYYGSLKEGIVFFNWLLRWLQEEVAAQGGDLGGLGDRNDAIEP